MKMAHRQWCPGWDAFKASGQQLNSISLLQLQPHDDSHASLKGELVEGRLEDNLGDQAQVSSKAFIH
jgi:hypothetical protein